ncbi:MAG TPA: diacylglycerol kinase family protein [Pyrinomonadaceae bacterium]|nr:diacylglycerol kinase family protein [Pyrinomonadaceae bacterium]
MTRTVDVIVNSSSGTSGGAPSRDSLAALFRDAGLEARIRLARDGAEAFAEARAAVSERDGDAALVAGGGDGTIGAIASLVAGTKRRLGVLPLGTFNHFAKDLGLPLDFEAAARVAAEGRTVTVDVGEVNGRVFVNNSSIGIYPRIVRSRRKQQERLGRGKWAALFFAAVAVFRRYPFLIVRLSADGRTLVRRTPFVFVGNNVYEMEGLQIGARRRLDEGVLSLYVTHRTGRLGLVVLALRALVGRISEAKDFDALTAKEIWIETRRPRRLKVATDGEVTVMRTPLRYRIRPLALRVIVPEEVTSDE